MSWYARPFWAFFLYVLPCFVILLFSILLHAKYYNKVTALLSPRGILLHMFQELELVPWTLFQLYYDAYQALWTIFLIIGILVRVRSTFIALTWVFFASIGNILKSSLFGKWRGERERH